MTGDATADAVFEPDLLSVAISGVPVDGWVWTNVLTAAYVHENSAYSS